VLVLLKQSVFLSNRCSKDVYAPDATSAERAVREWLATRPLGYEGVTVTHASSIVYCDLFSDETIAVIAKAMVPKPEPVKIPTHTLPEEFINLEERL
jgi:hypothetical protein